MRCSAMIAPSATRGNTAFYSAIAELLFYALKYPMLTRHPLEDVVTSLLECTDKSVFGLQSHLRSFLRSGESLVTSKWPLLTFQCEGTAVVPALSVGIITKVFR